MKLSLIYTGLALLVLSSCSTAYKAGQTPDDVYYSPARETDSYVVVDRKQDRYNDRYNDYDADRYYEDRFLRMRVMNRGLWSSLDYYYANPYAFSPHAYYHSWNSPWNSAWAWNSFHNPYFNSGFGWGGWNGWGGGWGGWNSWAGGGWGGWGPGIIVGGGSKPVTRPSRALVFNPGSYLPNNQQNASRNTNSRYNPGSLNGSSRYNNSNSGGYNNNSGRVSNNNNSYQPSRNNNSNNTPSRSYTPSSSGGGSSRSSGGSSGGGVSRPIR